MILPLCSASTPEEQDPALGFPAQEEREVIGVSPTVKMTWGLQYLSYKRNLRELGLLGLKKTQGNCIHVCKYLTEGVKELKPVFFLSYAQGKDKRQRAKTEISFNFV